MASKVHPIHLLPVPAAAEIGVPPVSFEQAAATALAKLQRSVSELLAATPTPMRRAADVERAFGVDTKLGWQIHRIATSSNPLTTGTSVPAPVSVERFLKAATRLGMASSVVARAAAAFDEFETLVDEYAGDRDRFLTMVTPLVDEDNESLDLKHKKAMYRAMSHITGVDAQADLFTSLLHPGVEAGTFCGAMVHTTVGLHRLRSGAPLHAAIGIARTSAAQQWNSSAAMEMMIAPVPGTAGAFLLRDYCSRDLSREVRVIGAGTTSPVLEIPEAVGRKNRVTIATASFIPDVAWDEPIFWSAPRVKIPTEAMVCDVLIHRDAYPAKHPVNTQVQVFNNDRIGVGSGEPDHAEVTDLLNIRERCDYLGCGVDLISTPDSPKHVDMVRSVCEAMKWNPDEFHCYRCRVEYPVLRSTVRVEFNFEGKLPL